MAGNVFYNLFYLIKDNPVAVDEAPELPELNNEPCCSDLSLKVLADTASDDTARNDVSGFLWWFNSAVTGASMELMKWDSTTSAYVSIDDLDNDTYGTFYDFAFFTNDAGENFIGYQMEWKEVLDIFGEGAYYVKLSVTMAYGASATIASPTYCLKTYTKYRANGTVKLEYWLNGQMGEIANDKKYKDLGTLNWYNSYRLKGNFGFPNSEYKEEFIKYDTGEQVWTDSEQEQFYTLSLKLIPNFIHKILRTDFMQADVKMITDYNKFNPDVYLQKQVINAGNYTPTWTKGSLLAPVELKFKNGYNNLKKLRE